MEYYPYSPSDPNLTREEMLADLEKRAEAMLSAPVREVTNPDPSVTLVFHIMHLARAFDYHLTQATKGTAMTAAQARFAWILATSPWPIPLQNLEGALGMSQPGVSRMISRMQDRGHVTCEASGMDVRAVVATLTDSGQREWELVRDRLRGVRTEVEDTLGRTSANRFAENAAAIAALDERDAWFEMLRHPLRFLS